MRLAEHTHTHTYTCTHTHTHTHTHTQHTQNLNSYSCWLDMLSRVWRRSKSSTFACRSFICVFACLQAWQKINNVSLRGVSRARTPLPSHNLLQSISAAVLPACSGPGLLARACRLSAMSARKRQDKISPDQSFFSEPAEHPLQQSIKHTETCASESRKPSDAISFAANVPILRIPAIAKRKTCANWTLKSLK